jgi:Cu2+-exporting ATPase/Cu+-exporting ATPase
MNTETFLVKGMHCASCSAIIEKTLKRVRGVESVQVNYGTEKANITFDPHAVSPQDLSGHIEKLGYSLSIPQTADAMRMSPREHAAHTGMGESKHEKIAELKAMRSLVLSSLPLALVSIAVMIWDALAQFHVVPAMSSVVSEFVHHLLPVMATYMLLVVGRPT